MTPKQLEYARKQGQRGVQHPNKLWLYDRPAELPGPRSSMEMAIGMCNAGYVVSDRTVRSWWDKRKIPYKAARLIARKWKYKATDENWPNGIWYPAKSKAKQLETLRPGPGG